MSADMPEHPAQDAYDRGMELFVNGRYAAAIEAAMEAQEQGWEPSGVLENLIGASHGALGDHSQAIRRHSNAIRIEDNPMNRVSRAGSHLADGECQPAISDARAALGMEAMRNREIHTDAEANFIIAICLLLGETTRGPCSTSGTDWTPPGKSSTSGRP